MAKAMLSVIETSLDYECTSTFPGSTVASLSVCRTLWQRITRTRDAFAVEKSDQPPMSVGEYFSRTAEQGDIDAQYNLANT